MYRNRTSNGNAFIFFIISLYMNQYVKCSLNICVTSVRYKYKEELAEATTEQIWRRALSVAVDGDRMVLWAYDVVRLYVCIWIVL